MSISKKSLTACRQQLTILRRFRTNLPDRRIATGDGNEVAHIDLMIGDKNGPIGQAFANGMTQLSAGHTPVLAVIRPNLPPKPHTLIVPKVTIKNMEDTGKIFGPAQAAVAKAIADSAEEGVIPANKLDELGYHLQCLHSSKSYRLPQDISV